MNMRKYASYKQAAKRIIRLMEKRAGLNKSAQPSDKPYKPGAGPFDSTTFEPIPEDVPRYDPPPTKGWYWDWLVKNNAQWGSDGKSRYFDDDELGTLPENHWNRKSVENYDLSDLSKPFHTTAFSMEPGFWPAYDAEVKRNQQLNLAIRKNWQDKANRGETWPIVPSATTTSRYNAKNGWRDHSWKKWFTDMVKGKKSK